MRSLVASTSDTIRIWDLSVSGVNKQQSTNAGQHSRLGSTRIAPDDGTRHVHVSTGSAHTADTSNYSVDRITSVSWAADGNTFAVGGKGSFIRQYGRSGELIQNVKLNRRTEQAGAMDIVAVRHYGRNSEALFIANNTKKQVRRWDFVRKEYTAVCQTHENKISCMAVCTKKRMIATATAQGGEIALFNLLHNTRSDLRSATRKALTCIDIGLGHKSQIAVGSEEGLLQLFDTARSGAAPLRSFSQTHFAPIRGLAFHPFNNSTLISAGLDGRVVITDTSSYSSSSVGSGLVISAGSPLTCLSCIQDTQIVGVGTLDGDVLIFDARMAAAPLWQASVKPGAAVVDMDFSYCVDENNVPESQPLRRSSSVSEARMPSHHITDHSNERESSCDSAAASLQPERRRIGGLSVASEAVRRHEERHTKPVSSSLFVDGKGKTNFRPPQHPSISKFRAAVTEHQLKAATGKLSKTAALRSPASPEHCREQREPGYESIVNSEGFAPLALNSENISLLAKDRSYMDLLSPAKTGKFTGITGDTLLTPALNDNMLSILSGVKPQSDEEENVGLSHNNSLEYIQDGCVRDAATKEAQTACAKDTAINSARAMPRDMSLCFPERNVAAATNLQFNDPSPMSLPQHTQPKPKPSQDHSQKLDTGDSIMEMFTPERLPRCTTAPVHTLAKNESEYDHLTSGKSTDSIPRMLVSQLLNNKHPARPDERSPADTRTIAAVSDIGHHPATSAPSEPFEQHISAAAPINSKQAPIETSLRSISSSVLQNAISDALAPVCDQIRGEIRNLHLDILRQGFVYQEQVKALRQECGEARALRQEIENLRQENEQLRRYVPFFGEGQGDVNNPSSI